MTYSRMGNPVVFDYVIDDINPILSEHICCMTWHLRALLQYITAILDLHLCKLALFIFYLIVITNKLKASLV